MRELSQLGQFVRLADYLFVEAVMATAVTNVEELLGVLTAHKQQVGTVCQAQLAWWPCWGCSLQLCGSSVCSAALQYVGSAIRHAWRQADALY